MTSPYLTPEEAGEFLRYSRRTVMKMQQLKLIPASCVFKPSPRKVLFIKDRLEAWAAKQTPNS